MEEIWHKINNYSNYEVSSYGRVKSLSRIYTDKLGRVFHLKEKILKTSTHINYRNNQIWYTKVRLIND